MGWRDTRYFEDLSGDSGAGNHPASLTSSATPWNGRAEICGHQREVNRGHPARMNAGITANRVYPLFAPA